jgi:site-specific recombinase XerD
VAGSQGTTAAEPPPPRLLDQVRDKLRLLHYAKRTEEAYVDWIRRYILFHGQRDPREMRTPEVEAFLTHLAVQGNVAASTQNQAFSALLFLYQWVLEIELTNVDAIRAKKPERLPLVLSVEEVRQVLNAMPEGQYRLMAELLYGTGMRVLECCRLRIKDIDFVRGQILVREGKGSTVTSGRKRSSSAGSGGSFCSTASGIPRRWRSRRSSNS